MPINIYEEDTFKKIANLSSDKWDLPNQLDDFEVWLKTEGVKLPKSKYVADIGFDIRKNANGGGAIINLEMIKILAKIGMEIYLSEYPNQI
jgi:hypothetical protein